MKAFDLNVNSPEKVSAVLLEAARAFRESQAELQASWQDKNAGYEWGIIARCLEKCVDNIEKKLGGK